MRAHWPLLQGRRATRWGVLLLAISAGGCGSRISLGDLGGGAATGGAAGGIAENPPGLGGGGEGPSDPPARTCATSFDQVLAIQTDCPDAPPSDGDSCEEALENGICVWQLDLTPNGRGYRAAGCYQGVKGKVWWGADTKRGDPFGPEDAQCPKQAPAAGAPCTSRTTETCVYPTSYCECNDYLLPGQWLCTEALSGKTSPPVAVEPLCPASGISEDVQVNELSQQAALQWCQWYADPSGNTRPAVSGRDSAGVADSYGYLVLSTPEMPVCLADLPIELCVQNLRLNPCTATLRALDDCVETIRAAPLGWVGHGCAPLLSNPTCSGTIVQPYVSSSKISHCVVPLAAP